MISTRILSALPDVAGLKRLMQSLATLDAILCPDWDGRYYSFNNNWSANESMGSMRDGSGDEYFCLFTSAGAILKGFAHEAHLSPFRTQPPKIWPGIYDSVPAEFAGFLKEPAFSISQVTFCIWRLTTDTVWSCGKIDFPSGGDPDGSVDLLKMLDGKPDTYHAWAEEYYEMEINRSAVGQVYAHVPLTASLVKQLNEQATLTKVQEDIDEIGYPARK